jgi:membrane fusion protein (multidrug efflux system)
MASQNRRVPVIVLGVAAAVAALASWASYTSDGSQKARERDARLAAARENGPAEPSRIVELEVFTVRRASAREVVELSGVLEPVRSTWVAAEREGRIVEVAALEHSPIAEGEVLVRLDPALARAELIRARAAHALAVAELGRQRRLGTRSVASEAELDRAVAEERRAFAALAEARTRLEHTTLRAPFDGIVNSLDFDPGAYVQPGTRIAEVLDISALEVTVAVSDRQVSEIRPGVAVRVRVDPLGNSIHVGRVVRVGRAPNPTTQRYPVVVELENPDAALLAGMLAYVELEVGNSESLRLPRHAVRREFELDYVFAVATEEGRERVERRRVKTRPVPFRPDWLEVVEGLDPGTRIAITAIARLHDGVSVKVLRDVAGELGPSDRLRADTKNAEPPTRSAGQVDESPASIEGAPPS